MRPTSALFEIVSAPFKRSQEGLFHGKTRQSGNSVPFSKKKTLRNWLPNIQSTRLYSEAFAQNLRVTVTVRALRTIKKLGGLDNYVLQTKPELLQHEGMRLRVMIRERLAKNARSTSVTTSALVEEEAGHAAVVDSKVLATAPSTPVQDALAVDAGTPVVVSARTGTMHFPLYKPRNNHAPPSTMVSPGMGMVRRSKADRLKKRN